MPGITPQSSDSSSDAESTFEIIDTNASSDVGQYTLPLVEHLKEENRLCREESERIENLEKTNRTLLNLLKKKIEKEEETKNEEEIADLNHELRKAQAEKERLNQLVQSEQGKVKSMEAENRILRDSSQKFQNKCKSNESLIDSIMDENRLIREQNNIMKNHEKTNLTLITLLKEKLENEETAKKCEEIASLTEMLRIAEADKETLQGRLEAERELVNAKEVENFLLKEAKEDYKEKCKELRANYLNRDEALRSVTLARGTDGFFGFQYWGTLIFSIRDGTPAHINGIKAGDQLVSVGGVQVETLSRADIAEVLKGAKGDRIELVLRSNPERLNDMVYIFWRVFASWVVALVAIFVVFVFF